MSKISSKCVKRQPCNEAVYKGTNIQNFISFEYNAQMLQQGLNYLFLINSCLHS